MSFETPRKARYPETVAGIASSDVSDNEGADLEAIDWQETDEVIGPTPQKNGRFLSLFEMMSPVAATVPSPVSKRKLDDAFPPRCVHKSAKSTKSPLKTPAFLRKQVNSFNPSDAQAKGQFLFPSVPKRGLSVLINELREMEDNDEDEGLNVLREMEANFSVINEEGLNDRESKDKQAEGKSIENESSEKVKWKKKGLKRAHRKVVMRPTTTRKKDEFGATQTQQEGDDDSEEYINSEDEAAAEKARIAVAASSKKSSTATSTKSSTKKPRLGPQNFKSLKLRNKGAKGGGRFRGRGR